MLVHTQLDVAAARQFGPEAIIKAMADIMVDQWTLTGSVTEEDLRASGFTAVEVAKYGEAARDRAAKLGLDLTDLPSASTQTAAIADLSGVAASFQSIASRVEADIKRLQALAKSAFHRAD